MTGLTSAASSNSIMDQLSIKDTANAIAAEKKELGQEEFLELMTAQLENQDPMAPMENGEFIAQMAQFGTVEGIGSLQTSFDELSSAMTATDATDAASLVGKSVLSEGEIARLEVGNDLRGAVDVPEGMVNMQVGIETLSGELIHSFDMDNQAAGLASFSWDGMLDDGSVAQPGNYRIRAVGSGVEGPDVLDTFVGTRIDSISMGGEGKEIVVNLSGQGSKPLSEVSRIGL